MTVANHTPDSVDVLIIGMGPVGAMAGLLLARAGHSVLIAERKEKPYPLPRAVAHDAEIARLLQSAGMAPDTMPAAVEAYDDMYVWVNGADVPIHQVDWTGIGTSGWNNTYFYHQPSLEAHLAKHVQEHPNVVVSRGVSAEVIDQHDHGVSAMIKDLATSSSTIISAKYVLAADGASSPTREKLDMPWHDLGYFYDWLVVDIVPGPEFHIDGLAKQVCDPARPTTVVPGGPGRRRWEFMLLEGEDPEQMKQPERIWELLAPFGATPENSSLERGVIYTFSSGWAESWRQGRVFLLGDAAHKMPPFAGQGLAAGFRDVKNLVWKLDRVLRDEASDALLDTYSTERREHVAGFIDFSMSLGRIICITDPQKAAQRDASMLAAIASGDTPKPPPEPRLGAGLHTGPHGGVLSWQGRITTSENADPRRFDDVFGSGALVLSNLETTRQLREATRRALESKGLKVVTFGMEDDPLETEILHFTDIDGTYAAWFAELGATAVLIRPDFYVFGSCAEPDGVDALARAFLDGLESQTLEKQHGTRLAI